MKAFHCAISAGPSGSQEESGMKHINILIKLQASGVKWRYFEWWTQCGPRKLLFMSSPSAHEVSDEYLKYLSMTQRDEQSK